MTYYPCDGGRVWKAGRQPSGTPRAIRRAWRAGRMRGDEKKRGPFQGPPARQWAREEKGKARRRPTLPR